MSLDEFGRIDAIRRVLREAYPEAPDGVLVAIGDDAAVFRPSGDQVLSVDTSVEGVHFERHYASPDDLGWRAFMAASSDLAAMGASGSVSLVSLILPEWVDDDALLELMRGVGAASASIGAPVVGGNLSSGRTLSITTTVVGETDAPLLRTGAQPGETVFATGFPGARALGLKLIQAGENSGIDGGFADAWRRPDARIDVGVALRGHATACIDISDGLAQDLAHLCRASGVGAEIELSRVRRLDCFDRTAAHVDADPDMLMAYGGEDYELLFTARAHDPVAHELATPIGVVTDGDVVVRGMNGEPMSGTGFRHFV